MGRSTGRLRAICALVLGGLLAAGWALAPATAAPAPPGTGPGRGPAAGGAYGMVPTADARVRREVAVIARALEWLPEQAPDRCVQVWVSRHGGGRWAVWDFSGWAVTTGPRNCGLHDGGPLMAHAMEGHWWWVPVGLGTNPGTFAECRASLAGTGLIPRDVVADVCTFLTA